MVSGQKSFSLYKAFFHLCLFLTMFIDFWRTIPYCTSLPFLSLFPSLATRSSTNSIHSAYRLISCTFFSFCLSFIYFKWPQNERKVLYNTMYLLYNAMSLCYYCVLLIVLFNYTDSESYKMEPLTAHRASWHSSSFCWLTPHLFSTWVNTTCCAPYNCHLKWLNESKSLTVIALASVHSEQAVGLHVVQLNQTGCIKTGLMNMLLTWVNRLHKHGAVNIIIIIITGLFAFEKATR